MTAASGYVLLREKAAELDPGKVAAVLAPILGHVRADLHRELLDRPGVLVGGLSEYKAAMAVDALNQAGCSVFALPESDVVVPPPVREIRRGKVIEEGFLFEEADSMRLAPWSEIVYFDAVQVQTAKNVVAHDREWDTSGEEGVQFRDVAYLKLETGWQELLEVVCYEPWVHLRIDKTTFRFNEANLPRYPTATKSYLALAIAFKTRCAAAGEGPGVELLFDGSSKTRQRLPNMKMHENLLLWRLTLRFRRP